MHTLLRYVVRHNISITVLVHCLGHCPTTPNYVIMWLSMICRSNAVKIICVDKICPDLVDKKKKIQNLVAVVGGSFVQNATISVFWTWGSLNCIWYIWVLKIYVDPQLRITTHACGCAILHSTVIVFIVLNMFGDTLMFDPGHAVFSWVFSCRRYDYLMMDNLLYDLMFKLQSKLIL